MTAIKAAKRERTRRANGVATRQRILETATEMFSASGYEATSLRQIAASAGIDLATLKYHYGDKAALFTEIYERGHQAYAAALGTLGADLMRMQSPDELRRDLPSIVARVHAHLESNLPFVRMTLYRMLERPSGVIAREEQIQDDIVALIVQALDHLQARAIIRRVDSRGVAVMLIATFAMLFVSTHTKPGLLGASAREPERFQAFFVDLLGQLLVAA